LTNVSISQDDDFLAIGGYDANGSNFGLHGYLQEVIFYGDLDTIDRQRVEADVMKTYGIPEPSSLVLVLMGIGGLSLVGLARGRNRRPELMERRDGLALGMCTFGGKAGISPTATG